MKRIIAVVCLILLSGGVLIADIGIVGKEEMVEKAELIALVEIKELISADKTKSYGDLIAGAWVTEALKGDAGGKITFRIERFFPCAVYDVSTGDHLVFLAKNEKGEYIGVNWFMSYLYLGDESKTIEWIDHEKGITEKFTPVEAVRDIKKLLEESPEK